MTKTTILEELAKGSMVTHRFFNGEEWMKQIGGVYQFEDGVKCTPEEFWEDRQEDTWSYDWEVIL